MISAFYHYKGELHEVKVDDADRQVLYARRWSITNCSRHRGHPKHYLRARTWEHGKQKEVIYLHRLLTGALPGTVVDHLDGNGLNNTRGNFRVTTQADNARAERQNHKRFEKNSKIRQRRKTQ